LKFSAIFNSGNTNTSLLSSVSVKNFENQLCLIFGEITTTHGVFFYDFAVT